MVLSVSDGDTLSAVVIGTPEKIRLTGIIVPNMINRSQKKLRN